MIIIIIMIIISPVISVPRTGVDSVKLLHQSVHRFVGNGVHPDAEAGGDTVHESEPGERFVLIHDNVPELEDHVALKQGEQGDKDVHNHVLGFAAEIMKDP